MIWRIYCGCSYDMSMCVELDNEIPPEALKAQCDGCGRRAEVEDSGLEEFDFRPSAAEEGADLRIKQAENRRLSQTPIED